MSRPGARIYGRSHDPYQTRLPEHLAYQRWNRKNTRMPGQAKVRIRYRGLATTWFDYLLLSPEELVGLLQGTPWLLTDLIQDGADYTAELTLE